MEFLLSLFTGSAAAAIDLPAALDITAAITAIESAAGDYVTYIFGIIGVIVVFWVARKIMGLVNRTVRGK